LIKLNQKSKKLLLLQRNELLTETQKWLRKKFGRFIFTNILVNYFQDKYLEKNTENLFLKEFQTLNDKFEIIKAAIKKNGFENTALIYSISETSKNGGDIGWISENSINKKILDQSKDWATRIAEELKYIGTLCVEFFIDRNENLYVNEIAPRVHNSGHLTINAYNISQFENHVRAVCSLEKISLKKLSNAKMINLIGKEIEPYRQNFKLNDQEFFFDYLKKEIKEKRKMGHITTLK